MQDDVTGAGGNNPVRANNIKLQKEFALTCGITGHIYSLWKGKFCNTYMVNKTTGARIENKGNNENVASLIKEIDKIYECRLVYADRAMICLYSKITMVILTGKSKPVMANRLNHHRLQLLRQ